LDLEQKLSEDEFALMVKLLKRYAATDMDQHESWKFDISSGTVYLILSMSPLYDGTEDSYSDLNHLLN